MTTKPRTFEYTEEDGWPLTRGYQTFYVYGTCEGRYSYHYLPVHKYEANGDPGRPEESELIQYSFDCSVDRVEDEDGNVVDITLARPEENDFEAYMEEQLEEGVTFDEDY